MGSRDLLLMSSSRDATGGFLDAGVSEIAAMLGVDGRSILFVPYAGVTISLDAYAQRVADVFEALGHRVTSAHHVRDPARAAGDHDAIVVGGGNTFQLLRHLYETDLLAAIRERVSAGVPYIGWSAGSVVACPTMKTTNDMPITEPPRLEALGLVPFQINPHYTDVHPDGFRGETRAERIAEFLELNPDVPVLAMREGSMLRVTGDRAELRGRAGARLFVRGGEEVEYEPGAEMGFLLSASREP